MKSVRSFVLLTVLAFVFPPIGVAQEKAAEQLGKVHFPVSCSPRLRRNSIAPWPCCILFGFRKRLKLSPRSAKRTRLR